MYAVKDLKRPEILAPAGDWDCLRAAVENGADAVYFGLKGEFNARARAANFPLEALAEVMDYLRQRGARGYLALNTLFFEEELEAAEDRIRKAAAAGVDAVIVQDLGVARLAREISPDLPVHASTQMTVTNAEGAEYARRCGACRVILARELSLQDIEKIHAATDMELEVFVHGALCVSYSGQCLTSEVWGGRSANRGECAQACRLPYDLVVDGVQRDLGPYRYLISPKDLAAWDLLPELVRLGIRSLKIEGRLKRPEYVAGVTAAYRRALDRTLETGKPQLFRRELYELEQTFSRGLAHGFLGGTDHQALVEGRSPKKRGVYLGRVLKLDPPARAATISLAGPLKRGDGILFEGPDPEAGEEGGPVYGLRRKGESVKAVELEEASPERPIEVEMRFGRERGPDLKKVAIGTRVLNTSVPALDRRLRATFAGGRPLRKAALSFEASGRPGEKLRIAARDDGGHEAEALSAVPLEPARNQPLTSEVFAEQLGRLGPTIFSLKEVEVDIPEPAMLPVSELNRMRRELVEALLAQRQAIPRYRTFEGGAVERLRAKLPSPPEPMPSADLYLGVMARNPAHVEAALAEGVEWIYLDFLELVGLSKAVARVLEAGRKPVIATPRLAKPGEAPIIRKLLDLKPAGILARHLGGLERIVRAREEGDAAARSLLLIGDFSLNASNALTAAVLFEHGLDFLTPSYDLNIHQLLAMLVPPRPDRAPLLPADRFEIVVHQHLPMFHMEHCVFAAALSSGTDSTNCGRPCERHGIALRDRTGRVHPVLADIGCRNTVFNDRPQSAAEYLERFRKAGCRRFRVELLGENAAQARGVIQRYRGALAGEIAPRRLFRELNVENQFGVVGVTRGTLPVVR
ncbi:MAG: U32 family peptidase [Planctomycetes bacterium]|nr:U32 family peptidase [Planctomycetota bacterium]